ncbi:ammonium transporter, partial [Magnetospirillum aberrantis SpK]|nr:ammonium transporter [Magnetospirillum aberrantis SpK]
MTLSFRKAGATLAATLPALLASGVAFAQEAADAAAEAAAAVAAPTLNSGDTAWMLVSSVLVLMMLVPGLALFYGGLVRKKNI